MYRRIQILGMQEIDFSRKKKFQSTTVHTYVLIHERRLTKQYHQSRSFWLSIINYLPKATSLPNCLLSRSFPTLLLAAVLRMNIKSPSPNPRCTCQVFSTRQTPNVLTNLRLWKGEECQGLRYFPVFQIELTLALLRWLDPLQVSCLFVQDQSEKQVCFDRVDSCVALLLRKGSRQRVGGVLWSGWSQHDNPGDTTCYLTGTNVDEGGTRGPIYPYFPSCFRFLFFFISYS